MFIVSVTPSPSVGLVTLAAATLTSASSLVAGLESASTVRDSRRVLSSGAEEATRGSPLEGGGEGVGQAAALTSTQLLPSRCDISAFERILFHLSGLCLGSLVCNTVNATVVHQYDRRIRSAASGTACTHEL